MKVLMISLDRSCLREGSPQREKIMRYGGVLDELHVIIFYSGPRLPRRIDLTSTIHIYPTNHFFRYNPFYFLKSFIIGARIIRARRFNALEDVVTAQDPFPTGCVAYALACAFRLPFQLQIHIDFFNPSFLRESVWHRAYAVCARFFAPKANSVRVVSKEIARYLESELGISRDALVVLPVVPDTRHIREAVPHFNLRAMYPQFSHIGLMVCRLVRQKGILLALHAMHSMARTHPRVGLIIVGSGSEEEYLKNSARELALDNIVFIPWTADVISYYKGADFFLLTSLYEGWGLTVLEAMTAGLPVIATPVGCVPELIKSGINGYIAPHADPLEFARAMGMLCDNPLLLKRMAFAAQDTIIRQFDASSANYARAYKQALSHAISH